MTVIGIDIGKTGAICVIEDDRLIEVFKMPDTPANLVAKLYPLIADKGIGNIRVAVEKQQAGVFGGKKGSKAGVKSMFTFGLGYGIVQGVLAGLHLPYEIIPPKTWQKSLAGLPRDKAERKTAVQHRMQARYPYATIHKYAADAVAIAHHLNESIK